MKIGMITDTYLPKIGGAEIHVNKLSAALRDRGHDVEIMTCTDGRSDIDGIPVTRLAYSPWDPNTDWRTLVTNDLRDITSFIRSKDVIHCHYTFLATALSGIVSTLTRKPMIVTLHGLGTLDSSVADSEKSKMFRRVSFHTADKIIATSEEMAEVAARYRNETDITVIPNGVDTTEFDPETVSPEPGAENKTIILSVRRLNPKNGVQYLVEASPMICDAIDDAEIWIAGNGGKSDMLSYLKRRTEELGTEDSVVFFGEVTNNRTKSLYKSADISTFPSSAESTSIACLEAMAMECGIVASDLDAYQTLLGDNERGLLVTLFDRDTSDYDAPMKLPDSRIEALSEAVTELANTPSLRADLGQEARKFVTSNYDWAHLAGNIEAMYRTTRRQNKTGRIL